MVEKDSTEYDYIVVGSGSAGAAVAARLSEDPSKTVLLLEAGPVDDNKWISMPLGFGKVLVDPNYMWQFASDPEPHLHNRSIPASRGKVLGGSSSVNGMVYVRGAPSDYDIWRQMGAAGWSYDDVLPFFRKAENQSRGADEYHGAGGPISVEDGRWQNPLADAFLNAANSVGIPRNHDLCRRDIHGVAYFQTTTLKGRRASTAAGYLKPARTRPNLHILTQATVIRLELRGRVATGVVYERDGATHLAHARQDIVLSAGSIVTPQLLQLSGIGDGELLHQIGVPVIHDLKGVGENMSDHLLVRRCYRTTSQDTLNALMASRLRQGMAGLHYIVTKRGPLAGGPVTAGGFVRSREGIEDPDLQIFFHPFAADETGINLLPDSSFQITFYQSRPQSRGFVRAKSPDPHHPPQIVGNYLSSEADTRTVTDAMRLIGRIADAEPLKKFGSSEIDPVENTDSALLGRARVASSTGYHHVGTTRMGTDAMSVVDPELRVHGIRKLRVADGSVMPTITTGNTNSVCIMIGEKCADLIRRAV